jgi:hypothetical protein
MAKKMMDQEDDAPRVAMSVEEMEREAARLKLEILETELETQKLALAEQREKNEQYKARKATQRMTFKQKQEALAKMRASHYAMVRMCRHKQGGKPDQRFKGNGPSSLHVTQMLDGKTQLIQCSRCPLAVMTPHTRLQREDPELYEQLKAEFDQLIEDFEETGLDPVKVPTFSFSQNGIPFLPEFEYEYHGTVAEHYA